MQNNKDGSLKGKEEQIENRKMEAAGDSNNNSKVDETLPPGFRFHPTDEELITYYLINKIADANFTGRAIGDVDLNKSEPWDLPGKAKMGEKEWYFFSLRDRKYPTGVRTNRATNTGYWKTTGKDKEIFNSVTSELVGMKKTLVFYRGRAPRGEKTNWVMHEYRIIHNKSALRTTKDEWVVSRVFQKSAGIKKYPTNQGRAVMNPYGLEIGSSTHHIMASPLMLQQAQAAHHDQNFQFPLGRSYINNAELAELTRSLLRGGGGGSNMSLPINNNNNNGYSMAMPNMGCGSGGEGGFTISGLNLNLGGAAAAQQPVLRPMQVAPPLSMGHHQDHMNSSSSSSMMHANSLGAAGFGAEMNGSGASNRSYMGMDNCVDLDSYWPAY